MDMAGSVLRRAFLMLAPLGLFLAGCGSMGSYVSNTSNAVFSIRATASSVTTNSQIRFSATLSSGAPAAVNWSVANGQNDPSLGQGAIDAAGLYTPPPALNHDRMLVQINAQLQSDPSRTASTVVEVTPGFLQPLAPENAALSLGATMPVRAQIAEVGQGSVHWSLSPSPVGGAELDRTYGTLSGEACQRSPHGYTACTVTYQAPASLPAGSVYVIGRINETHTASPAHILLNQAGITSTPLANQAPQTGRVQLGASGGNGADFDSDASGNVLDCCGGTLGALVSGTSGSQYILSNNHVLAESDHGSPGDTIVQPGLIDTACSASPSAGAGRAVGALRYSVPLATAQSNVDAALAAVNEGAVDPSGSILHLGSPVAGAQLGSAPPAAGTGEVITDSSLGRAFEVAKSGRTTGLTCSAIDAIHLAVEVDYFKDCAETQPYYTKTFTNQIGIAGDSFSDSGDSGALVVDARNAEPVGLFFAGGTDNRGSGYSVANPIQDVLNELGSQAGQQFRIVGGPEHPVACLNYERPEASASAAFPEAVATRAETAAQIAASRLVSASNGILGTAIGRSVDQPGDPAIVVYVDKNRFDAVVPQTINGIRTQVIRTEEASVANASSPKSPADFQGIHLPSRCWRAHRRLCSGNPNGS